MVVSPPGSPDPTMKSRPQSMMYPSSPVSDMTSKSRPQSFMYKQGHGVRRSGSRMSASSKHGGSRGSDEDAKTSVKVGEWREEDLK